MIQLEAVRKSYGEGEAKQEVLRSLSLEIQAHELVALTGASGSGKSTLLNLVGGLDQDYQGKILVDGQDLNALSDRDLSDFRNQYVGFIFQQFHLLPHLSVLENVLLPSWFSRKNHGKTTEDAVALLERVGLLHKLDAAPMQLSGGEKQRVAIARALLLEPKLLLCDEPTGALDSENSENIFQLIKSLHEGGLTVLLVTHERALAERCERELYLKDGQVAHEIQHKEKGAP